MEVFCNQVCPHTHDKTLRHEPTSLAVTCGGFPDCYKRTKWCKRPWLAQPQSGKALNELHKGVLVSPMHLCKLLTWSPDLAKLGEKVTRWRFYLIVNCYDVIGSAYLWWWTLYLWTRYGCVCQVFTDRSCPKFISQTWSTLWTRWEWRQHFSCEC